MSQDDQNLLPDPAPAPSGSGCYECEKTKGWWFHLRRCLTCGHIGCCDQSPSQHARKHWEETGHNFLTTFEPEELWLWDFDANDYSSRIIPKLLPPLHHPLNQTVPGPADRVPADWVSQLN